MKILVTDADYRHSLGIIRNLGLHGYHPSVLSFEKNSLCSKSRYCEEEIIIVPYEHNDFERRFYEILVDQKIDLVIPVGTRAFKKLVPLKGKITRYARMITVSQETFQLCISKRQTYDFAGKMGVPIPETFYPRHMEEINTMKRHIGYPCVIKGLYEMGYNIVDYAANEDELIKKYPDICRKYSLTPAGGLPLIQEYVSGFGCGFFAVYDRGKCGSTFQHRRIRETPPSGGASAAAGSLKNPLVREYGKRLLDGLKWHGVAMVEFKMTADNQPVLMEINPKFWGSTDLALEAGVNFPVELAKIAQGKEIAYSEKYRHPFKYHWPLEGEFFHVIDNPKNLVPVIKDCLNPSVKSNLWFFSDFHATLELFYLFLKTFKDLFVGFWHKKFSRT